MADRVAKIKAAAQYQRTHGIARAVNALYYTLPTAIGAFLLAEFGHMGWAVVAGVSPLVILEMSQHIGDFLEKPEVVKWISKVTDKDVETWEKLPPPQRALFADDMRILAAAAKKKGVKVSPAMSAFIAGAAASSEKKPKIEDKEVVKADPARGIKSVTLPTVKANPKDLLKQAGDLQSQFQQSGLAP